MFTYLADLEAQVAADNACITFLRKELDETRVMCYRYRAACQRLTLDPPKPLNLLLNELRVSSPYGAVALTERLGQWWWSVRASDCLYDARREEG